MKIGGHHGKHSFDMAVHVLCHLNHWHHKIAMDSKGH